MTDKDWLKGREFADWLLDEAGERGMATASLARPSFARSFHRWRTSPKAKVNVYSVDEILTHLFPDVDFRMIPEHIFSEKSNRRGNRPYPEGMRRKAFYLLEEGWTPLEIAREIGCDPTLINKWQRDERAAA